jgi:hypothetical protein
MARTAKYLEIQSRYIYSPEVGVCPHCGEPLRARPNYQWRKAVQHLDKVVYVVSQAGECVNPECRHQGQPYTSAAAQMVTVPECTYGLDVIAQIGWWRDREHLSRKQMHTRLHEAGVQISERQVDHLYARYRALLGCAEKLGIERLQVVVERRGGLIISLDGLAPEGASEQLWVVREVQEDLVLMVAWLPRVHCKALSVLLKPLADWGLPILVTVGDGRECVRKALQEVWPDVPRRLYRSHYLATSPVSSHDRDLELRIES